MVLKNVTKGLVVFGDQAVRPGEEVEASAEYAWPGVLEPVEPVQAPAAPAQPKSKRSR